MGMSLTYKILKKHLLEGEMKQGNEIKIKIDQTLTQDSTGTMVYLQLEAMGVTERKTELSVAYIDHNMLQAGFENADDHEFIKTAAAKYGIVYSKPGNGICHQIHLERFSKPGKVLIGSDSHTPTSGGMGMIAIGAGGLDVAVGIAEGHYSINVPKVMKVSLSGALRPYVTAKDVILYILGELSVKGGVGYVIEYAGEGLAELSLTDRATITNMGAELGATTSIFPSDERTKDFLTRQGRADDFTPMSADDDAFYDAILNVDLSTLKPMAAMPHSPDNVAEIPTLESFKIDQVAIGSCTNSSYTDLMKVAYILKGKKVHPDVSLVISPGSSNILKMMADNGALASLIASGARILEAGCGPCIGMGQAPKTGAISLRTFNRNFKGRCGTLSAGVYLVSPEAAAYSAIKGVLSDPRELGESIDIALPDKYFAEDNYFIYADKSQPDIKVEMGPNIKPFPLADKLEKTYLGKVLLKTGDNITTDDIMPSNAALLPFRSNIPELAKHCFATKCDDFKDRSDRFGGGLVIGGENYGQGSSREHAALVPLYLKVKVVIVKSFARIHKANLINAGIVPLEFKNPQDYDMIDLYDQLYFGNIASALKDGGEIIIENKTKGSTIIAKMTGSDRDRKTLIAGGTINLMKLKGQTI